MNNWILEEVISDMKLRVKSLEMCIEDKEINQYFKAGLREEVKWLNDELDEINLMKLEEVKEYEEAYEDERENRALAEI